VKVAADFFEIAVELASGHSMTQCTLDTPTDGLNSKEPAMRFLLMYRRSESETSPMKPETMMKLGQMCQDLAQRGILVTSEGLQPSDRGARVQLGKGKLTVTDGPFPETKELVAGIQLVQVNSRDEAVAIAKRFIEVAGDGETEIRQVFEAPPGH
jgi:hypothetical protein